MKFLLATDGSEHSEGAARFLARFDLSALDHITVLHAVPGMPFPHGGGPYSAALMQLGEEIAPAIIDATAGLLKNAPGEHIHCGNRATPRRHSRYGSAGRP